MRFICPKNWLSALEPHIKPNDKTLLMSVSQTAKLGEYEPEKLVVYNWDMYSWFDYSSEPWRTFIKLLRDAKLVIHTSEAARKQMEQVIGVSHGEVAKMFVPVDWLNDDISTGDYVLCPMRHYVNDKHFSWISRACDKLGIPLYHPNHSYDIKTYRRILQGARLIVSPYEQASTGGQGMIEATYCGKPVLAFDGELNGAKEYMGNRATYFKNYKDLEEKLSQLFFDTPKLDIAECRKWVKENYSVENMANAINKHL